MHRLADFYIIGAMKCATSTLHEQLARRQAFFMTNPKEPNFFNQEDEVERGFAAYARLFEGAAASQICGESSTHYTKEPTYKGTAARIHAHTPQARIVYVMRDPLKRMASQYMHEWTQREVTESYSSAVVNQERYIAYSSYARQLRPYLELFGRERVLPVFFEYLVQHPDEELQRIARFLGDASEEPFRWHEEAEKTNVSKDRMRQSPLRDKVLSFPGARRIKDFLPLDMKERIKGIWRFEKRPELSESALRHACLLLDSDLEELGGFLGLGLNSKNFSELAATAPPAWASEA